MRGLRGGWILAVALAGCAVGDDEAVTVGEPDFVWHEDHDHEEGFVDKSLCSGRWAPGADVLAAGQRQSVGYDGAGSRCAGGPSDGAEALADHVRANFRSLINRSVPGGGVQIYACRRVVGGSGMSVHSTGRALDIFVPTRSGGAADNAKGDQIAGWLAANAETIGVQAIIWDRTYWRLDGSAPRCYTGKHPHNDHVHVELTAAAGRMRTSFFTGGAAPVAPPPPSSGGAWIGDVCRGDADCGFSEGGARGACFLDHRPESGVGFCTLPCAGFCPDRSGHATTFCAEGEALGGFSGTGACAAKSSAHNGNCRSLPGFVELDVQRFVGRSGASPATATVCAPSEVLGIDDDGGEDPFEPPPANAGNNLCDDRRLPLSEHGYSCAGVPENTWRCACSASFETSVSQVCREGIWLNFQTDPRDCARCDGRYSSGCNR
jgi:hypothetical protein